ncbi:MAG: hypothetical protein JSW64_09510 [Candidatus Zixiibacteriota bacterium]|nr:MAG: hypothetical protein JSW64_09510 [candidate division Zixibacteria bacterium]
MYKHVLTAVIIALFCYGISYGQCDQEIFVADEDDLPYSGSLYKPCASSFSYVFEFDILRYSNPINNVVVFPKEISSQLNISVNSLFYAPGTGYSIDGDSYTGTGDDYLHAGILHHVDPDAFANMDWSVHYYDDEPD